MDIYNITRTVAIAKINFRKLKTPLGGFWVLIKEREPKLSFQID